MVGHHCERSGDGLALVGTLFRDEVRLGHVVLGHWPQRVGLHHVLAHLHRGRVALQHGDDALGQRVAVDVGKGRRCCMAAVAEGNLGHAHAYGSHLAGGRVVGDDGAVVRSKLITGLLQDGRLHRERLAVVGRIGPAGQALRCTALEQGEGAGVEGNRGLLDSDGDRSRSTRLAADNHLGLANARRCNGQHARFGVNGGCNYLGIVRIASTLRLGEVSGGRQASQRCCCVCCIVLIVVRYDLNRR